MVSVMRYIFFLMLLCMMSCVKNEFTLDFDLSDDITENYNVTYYATDKKDGGLTIQATASVNKGKCILKGVTNKPTLVYITPRLSHYPLVVLAERGSTLKIEGDDKNPLSWKIGNNKVNTDLSEWRIENLECLKNHETDSVNEVVKKYVEAHIDNPASTILMLCYYRRFDNEREYSELMNGLKGEARNPNWLHLVGRSDQLDHSYSYPAVFHNIIMRTNDNLKKIDTLSLDGKNPVFMLFWQTGANEKSQIVDSIKMLGKEFADSVRLIADICLDADSMAWRGAIRKDSIDFIKRFWTPRSLSDPDIIKLKVKSMPYYIVFDKNGAQYYSGKDLGEAISNYRKLMQKPDSVPGSNPVIEINN